MNAQEKLYIKLWGIGLLIVILVAIVGGIVLVNVLELTKNKLDYTNEPDVYIISINKIDGYNKVFYGQYFIVIYWQGNKVFQLGIEPIMG